MGSGVGRGAACGSLAFCILLASAAAAPAQETLTLDGLAAMSWPELEGLYRRSPAGAVPEGYAEGRAIYCPCAPHAALRTRLTDAVWRGKVFDAGCGTLVNQWCGFRAIRAEVSCGESWLDGGPSIVMDYGRTSRVWADVRDEAREVAPGLYLGRMYRLTPCGPQFQMFFALQTCCPR